MSRNLPIKKSKKHKLIIEAVKDFYNCKNINREIINVALWLMNRRKGVKLTEGEKEAVWYARNNLSDPLYTQDLEKDI